MALSYVTGFTDDGLVWVQFEGQQGQFGQKYKTHLTMEPDQAQHLGKMLLQSSEKAAVAKKREILVAGDTVTLKRR